MLAQIRPAIVSTLFFTVLLGIAYPLVVTGVGRLAFPAQAEGSLIRNSKGQVLGSRLLAQAFTRPEYFHPRPSAAGADGYDAKGSSGSNLGPLNPVLAERVAKDAQAIRSADPKAMIPADAVTTSGSGLDPDISPANARMQAARVATARGVSIDKVLQIIERHTTPPVLGVMGQPSVNVLEVNLALDADLGRRQPPAR